MSQPLTARHLIDFASVTADWNRIKVTVGPSGGVIMLTLKQQPAFRPTSDGDWSHVQAFVDLPKNYRIYHQIKDGWAFADIEETRRSLYFAQPLTRNHWLLAARRSASDADENGHICSVNGKLLYTMPLGDGIEDVQTTMDGQIWVSYFDEGVYGNTKLGWAGLARFEAEAGPQFNFNVFNGEHGERGFSIADCYAFNAVSDDEVWLCPYTDFPLIKLKDLQIDRKWENNPVHGSHAFAVWKDRVLFRGGYAEKQKLFIVYPYRADGSELKSEEYHAISASGGTIDFVDAFGRGSQLYLMTADSLYLLDLREI